MTAFLLFFLCPRPKLAIWHLGTCIIVVIRGKMIKKDGEGAGRGA
jgi:hypothetical protein